MLIKCVLITIKGQHLSFCAFEEYFFGHFVLLKVPFLSFCDFPLQLPQLSFSSGFDTPFYFIVLLPTNKQASQLRYVENLCANCCTYMNWCSWLLLLVFWNDWMWFSVQKLGLTDWYMGVCVWLILVWGSKPMTDGDFGFTTHSWMHIGVKTLMWKWILGPIPWPIGLGW